MLFRRIFFGSMCRRVETLFFKIQHTRLWFNTLCIISKKYHLLLLLISFCWRLLGIACYKITRKVIKFRNFWFIFKSSQFLLCGFGFTVRRTDISWVLTVESSCQNMPLLALKLGTHQHWSWTSYQRTSERLRERWTS